MDDSCLFAGVCRVAGEGVTLQPNRQGAAAPVALIGVLGLVDFVPKTYVAETLLRVARPRQAVRSQRAERAHLNVSRLLSPRRGNDTTSVGNETVRQRRADIDNQPTSWYRHLSCQRFSPPGLNTHRKVQPSDSTHGTPKTRCPLKGRKGLRERSRSPWPRAQASHNAEAESQRKRGERWDQHVVFS